VPVWSAITASGRKKSDVRMGLGTTGWKGRDKKDKIEVQALVSSQKGWDRVKKQQTEIIKIGDTDICGEERVDGRNYVV